MELSKRPIPQIPWTAKELAAAVRERQAQGLAALEKAFEGVSEEQAGARPQPAEWSAKEVLAHLIQNERHGLENLDDLIGGFPRLSDDFGSNSDVHIRAIVSAHKTTRGLLDELYRLSDELNFYLAAIPDHFISRKASYFQTASQLLDGSLSHLMSHLEQIKTAITAATK